MPRAWAAPDLNKVASTLDKATSARVALDTETFDPDLKSKGPGARRDGYLVGVSLAVEDGPSWYLPLRHEGGDNLDPKKALAMLRRWAGRFSGELVGANLMYDLEYFHLERTGPIKFDLGTVRLLDVQHAEPLLDGQRVTYALDELVVQYLKRGKEMDQLVSAVDRLDLSDRDRRREPQANIWRIRGRDAAAYALGDVRDPLDILKIQEGLIEREHLQEVWDLEVRLAPLILAMRLQGVRIDPRRARRTRKRLLEKRDAIITELTRLVGAEVGLWAPATITSYFEAEGLNIPRTPKTNLPSITKPWMERNQTHPAVRLYMDGRRYDKAVTTFLDGQILGAAIDGRVYPSIHQLRSDAGGTVTGRFSYSLPNLQFTPGRDEELAPLIRGCFVPEPGEMWEAHDYSQIEYRLLVHYARGRGADEARRKYNNDPETSFHVLVAEIAGMDHTHPPTYKKIKGVNFCKIYGGGIDTIAETAGMVRDEAAAFVKTYDENLPFVKETFQWVSRVAGRRGWIKSISGRRHRFTEWEPADWKLSKITAPFPTREGAVDATERLVESVLRNPGIYDLPKGYRPRHGVRRARTWRGLNYLLQGGAADIMKKGMVDVWESGVCDVVGIPLVTVHDELGFSRARTKKAKEGSREVRRLMEKAYVLQVPLLVDTASGKDWGACK